LSTFAGKWATRPRLLTKSNHRHTMPLWDSPSWSDFGFDRILYLAIFPNMPKVLAAPRRSPHEYRSGADVFKALGNPSRLLIVDELTHGERCVADLTALIGSDISTVSNHLAVLRNVGLVVDDRRGQQVFYRLGASCVANVFHCLEEIRAARGKVC
jgi:DNA-binding transcriptional ArsR family regulator